MKRPECKIAIRRLVHEWAETQERPANWHPSFSAFVSWLKEHGHGQYLDFRSTMGASYDAEQWFDEELKQGWRN